MVTSFGNSMPIRLKNRSPRRPESALTIAKLLVRWFRENARDLPWRRTLDAYAIWVSEIMLQQTKVKTVIPFWERWMKELPTVRSLADVSEARLLKLWEGLGYYSRVRNLQKAARDILARHAGRFPSEPSEILALPGIGRYTVGAIASIAFGQAQPLLDGNVIRVLTRLHGIRDNAKEKITNERLWGFAAHLVQAAATLPGRPKQGSRLSAGPCSDLNQSLMELGATVCLPANPTCPLCPIRKYCVAATEGLTDLIPDLGKRAVATKRRFIAFVVEREGSFLVRQRPSNVVNAGLWEFPNVELASEDSPTPPIEGFQFSAAEKPLLTVRHSITRYRITLDVYRAEIIAGLKTQLSGEWVSQFQLHTLAFSSAHAKIRAKIT